MTHPDSLPEPQLPDDAPLDPALLAAAAHYHAPPPAVPADAMWAAIQARRAAAAPGGSPVAPAPPPVEATTAAPVLRVERGAPAPARGAAWRRPTPSWPGLAAAAVALLAVGIGVGRMTAAPDAGAGAPGAVAATADERTAPPVLAAPTTVAEAGREPRPPRSAGGTTSTAPAPTSATTPAASPSTAPAAEARVPAPGAGGSTPLRVATDEHLARVEALLTTFAADRGAAAPPDAAAESDAVWARDLLVTTRLLLDSPAGRDPVRRALLEDLELVLVQIARLPRADTPVERALIERAIRRGDVLGRLRSTEPDARPSVSPRPVARPTA